MSMDFHQMWELNEDFRSGCLIAKCESQLSARENAMLLRREWHPHQPLLFRYHMGGAPGDLMATTMIGRYLFSDRVLQCLKSARFTGWGTYPVQVISRDGKEIQGYHGLAVNGRAGIPDGSRSK